MLTRSPIVNVALGSAVVLGGVWLYMRYGPRAHRYPAAVSAGTVIGKEFGALAGLAIGGPIAVFPASVGGAVAGAVIASQIARDP